MDRITAYQQTPLWDFAANPDFVKGQPTEEFWKTPTLGERILEMFTHLGLVFKSHCRLFPEKERTQAAAARALIGLEEQLSSVDRMYASKTEKGLNVDSPKVNVWYARYEKAGLDTPVDNPVDKIMRKFVLEAHKSCGAETPEVDGVFIKGLFQAKPVSDNAASDCTRFFLAQFSIDKQVDAISQETREALLASAQESSQEGVTQLFNLRQSIRDLKHQGFCAVRFSKQQEVAARSASFLLFLSEFHDTAKQHLTAQQ